MALALGTTPESEFMPGLRKISEASTLAPPLSLDRWRPLPFH